MDSAVVAYAGSLESGKVAVQQLLKSQANVEKLKANLRHVEDDLVKALAVKTHKEAEWMAKTDSISSTRARIEELKKIAEDQRNRNGEYAAVLLRSQQSLEKSGADTNHRGEIQHAIEWYNRVLGFRIEAGHGVKFIFTNINPKNPMEEYSFTVHHKNDKYTLLDCTPRLNDAKELIVELNRTNGLFKFVKIMRAKFQVVAAPSGFHPQPNSLVQQCSTISLSGPGSSVSTERSESTAKESDLPTQAGEAERQSMRIPRCKPTLLSPASIRQSPRLKAKKLK